VVDDDPYVLHYVRTTLEQAGYRVQAATTAADAIASYQAAEDEPFRLVLSDVVMPQVTGVDLAKRLLGQDAHANVIFMSGQVPPGSLRDYFQGGQVDLLEKPFRPERLLGVVRAALARGSSVFRRH
jgi:two-component system cell cycle sensor histidine kinase/response regulator CckA